MCILFYQHVRCRLGRCTMVLRGCCCVGSGSERLGFSRLWSGALAWKGGMARMRSVQIAETVPFTSGKLVGMRIIGVTQGRLTGNSGVGVGLSNSRSGSQGSSMPAIL